MLRCTGGTTEPYSRGLNGEAQMVGWGVYWSQYLTPVESNSR